MQKKELKNTANPLSLSEETIYERPELLIPSPNDIIEMGQADGTERITTRQELYDDIKEKVVLPEIPPPFELPIYLQGVPAGFSPTVIETVYSATSPDNNFINDLTLNQSNRQNFIILMSNISGNTEAILDIKPNASLYNTYIYLDILVQLRFPSNNGQAATFDLKLNGKSVGEFLRLIASSVNLTFNIYQLQGWYKIDGDGDIFKY